jgi:hypothetical protein
MGRLRTAALSLAATLFVAVGAGAQPAKTNMQFLGLGSPSVQVGNIKGGIYQAKWDGLVDNNLNVWAGSSTIDIVCVDLLHSVSSGQQWTANITNLGAANIDNSYLRFGGYSGTNGNDWLTRYRAAAYLSYQLKNTAPSSTLLLQEYHTAIWRTMTEATVYNVPVQSNSVYSGTDQNYTGAGYGSSTIWGSGSTGVVALMLNAKNYALNNANNTAFWSQFTVLSDAAMIRPSTGALNSGAWGPLAGGTQEFITFTATPEPASFALMGTGLLVVGYVGRRRKATVAADKAKQTA